MNSEFYLTLKRIRYNRAAFPDAREKLFEAFKQLQRTLNDYALKNSEALKQYALHDHNQITKESEWIRERLNKLNNIDIKALSSKELIEYERDKEYFSEILNSIDDARAELIEHLLAYYPDMFKNETGIKQIQKELKFSEVAAQFLGELSQAEQAPRVKTVFPDFLIHENKELLANRLRSEFKNERGKTISLMIKALKDKELLTIGTRDLKKTFIAIEQYFDTNIGSYESVRKFKYDEKLDSDDYKNIITRINQLLKP